MRILETNNKVPTRLQAELATYGILRDTAKKLDNDLTGPKYFGLAETPDAFNLVFTDDLRKLDDLATYDHQYKVAIVAPDNEEFDLLASKDYSKKLKLTDETNLRKYLLNLINSLP